MSRSRQLVVLLAALAMVASAASPVFAHAERTTAFPGEDRDVPQYTQPGSDTPTLVVCKPDTEQRLKVLPEALRKRNQELLQDCEFSNIQDAINAVEKQGTRILVMPGLYRELPYRGQNVSEECKQIDQKEREERSSSEQNGGDDNFPGSMQGTTSPGVDTGNNGRGTPALDYVQHVKCPHLQNLITVLGDDPNDDDKTCDNELCNLQIEGTGASPQDVVVDGAFKQLNGLRVDRADGFILKNILFQRFEFNSVYYIETNGWRIEDVTARYNDEYAFLTFAVDHGVYQNCTGYGNGDSAIYPGSSADIHQDSGELTENNDLRFVTEIKGCRGHHSAIGYSGTAGNATRVHHSEFDHNGGGGTMDSVFPGHPGLPQDHAYFHENLFHSNNVNYYEKYVQQNECTDSFASRDYDEGTVCPVVPVPVGTATFVAGGNYNLFEDNQYYDNWRQGLYQIWVPAAIRGDMTPSHQYDTSNYNTYRDNRFADNQSVPGAQHTQPNGVDFTWDVEGKGNCWEQSGDSANSSADPPVTSRLIENTAAPNVNQLPGCSPRNDTTKLRGSSVLAETNCANYSRGSNRDPEGCDWFDSPNAPDDREPSNATLERLGGQNRIETAVLASQEGYPDRAQTVILARADKFPDALAGAPLGEHLDAPVLLTSGDGLSQPTADEIERLGASRAVLLGGTNGLSEQVAADVEELGIDDVTRVGGASRFDTAVEIARLVGGGGNAYLAKGIDENPANAWADALSAAAVAAHQERPVLLTAQDQLPSAVSDYLDEGNIVDVRVVGGSSAVSEGVYSQLESRLNDIARIGGANRYETSLNMAKQGLRAGQDPTELYVASGENWPDALVSGSPAAVDESPFLLTQPDQLTESSSVSQWLNLSSPLNSQAAITNTIENVRILGGPQAVAPAVEEGLKSQHGMQNGDAQGDRSHGNQVSTGEFEVYDQAPAEYEDLEGTVEMTQTLKGTTRVDTRVQGLEPGVEHPVHVHKGACSDENPKAGPHFKYKDGAGDTPPNEIHPGVIADDAGVGVGSDTSFAHAGPEADSVAIHLPSGEKIACADLEGDTAESKTMPPELSDELSGLRGDTGDSGGGPLPTATPMTSTVGGLGLLAVAGAWWSRRRSAREHARAGGRLDV